MIASFFNYIFGYNKQNNHSNENKYTTHYNNDIINTSDKYKVVDYSENYIHEHQPEPQPEPEPQPRHTIGPTCQNMFSDISYISDNKNNSKPTRNKHIAIIGKKMHIDNPNNPVFQDPPQPEEYIEQHNFTQNDTNDDIPRYIEHKADIPDTPESISTLSNDSSIDNNMNYNTLPDPPDDTNCDHSAQPKNNILPRKFPNLNLKLQIPEPYSDHDGHHDGRHDDNVQDDDFLCIAPPIQRCSSNEIV